MNVSQNRLRRPAILAGVLLLYCMGAFGQTASNFVGNVQDQAAGNISNATVILFSEDRVRTAKTDQDGGFTFPPLSPGEHYLEASSPGFFPASIFVWERTPQPVTLRLHPGESSGCFVRPELAKINGVGYLSNGGPPNPPASYEPRPGDVQVAGTVGDAWGDVLADTLVNLTHSVDPNAQQPERSSVGSPSDLRLPEVIARVISNHDGTFEFSKLNLQPGWYSVAAIHEGYSVGSATFWIARENLSRISRVYLFPKSETHPCDG